MNCPYCRKLVYGMTGLQEVQKFQKHLAKCRKNPANIVSRDGRKTAVSPTRSQTLTEALEIRAASDQ